MTLCCSADHYYGEHALELKTIYRPIEEAPSVGSRGGTVVPQRTINLKAADFNQINEVLDLLNATIKENVQRHCEVLTTESQTLLEKAKKFVLTYLFAVS